MTPSSVQVLEADVAGGGAGLLRLRGCYFIGRLKQAIGHIAEERTERLALVVAHNGAAQST